MVKEDKFTPEIGRGGPQRCKTSRLPHFLTNELTDGGEIVSLTRRPHFTFRKIPSTHFCYRLSRPQDCSSAERKLKNSSDLIGNGTRDLSACSIVPQPSTLPRAPITKDVVY
jgi:hypothetical protein